MHSDFDVGFDSAKIIGRSLKPAILRTMLSVNVPPNQQIDLTGKVAAGSVQRSGGTLRFAVRDRNGTAKVPVVYTGVVPDPFRVGREVVVTGHLRNGVFVGERDSLVTKCPSKFQAKPPTGTSPSKGY